MTAHHARRADPSSAPITFNFHPDQLPDIYAMQVSGTCMLPMFEHGMKLMFSRLEPCEPGDIVVLYRRPDLVRPGQFQCIVKRLVIAPPSFAVFGEEAGGDLEPVIIAEQLNPHRHFPWRMSQLQGMHKCLGEVPADVPTYTAYDEDVCQNPRRRLA